MQTVETDNGELVPVKGWNTAAILDATVTVMLSHHGYEAVLEVIESKMRDEAKRARSDAVFAYSRTLENVANQLEAAIGTLAYCHGRKPA